MSVLVAVVMFWMWLSACWEMDWHKKISLPWVTLPEIIMLTKDCIYGLDPQILQGP